MTATVGCIQGAVRTFRVNTDIQKEGIFEMVYEMAKF